MSAADVFQRITADLNALKELYRRGMTETDDPKGVEVFEAFFNEKSRQENYFQKVNEAHFKDRRVSLEPYRSILPSRQWIERGHIEIQRIIMGRSFTFEMEILKTGLTQETTLYELLSNIALALPDHDKLTILSFLAVLDGNIALLKTEIQYLEERGFWYDFAVFRFDAD